MLRKPTWSPMPRLAVPAALKGLRFGEVFSEVTFYTAYARPTSLLRASCAPRVDRRRPYHRATVLSILAFSSPQSHRPFRGRSLDCPPPRMAPAFPAA